MLFWFLVVSPLGPGNLGVHQVLLTGCDPMAAYCQARAAGGLGFVWTLDFSFVGWCV